MTTQDTRTDEERALTVLYVCMTDRFMSGWGHAPGRSLYCIGCKDLAQAQAVYDATLGRSEMQRVRIQSSLPRLRAGDHLAIRGLSDATWWRERIPEAVR